MNITFGEWRKREIESARAQLDYALTCGMSYGFYKQIINDMGQAKTIITFNRATRHIYHALTENEVFDGEMNRSDLTEFYRERGNGRIKIRFGKLTKFKTHDYHGNNLGYKHALTIRINPNMYT